MLCVDVFFLSGRLCLRIVCILLSLNYFVLERTHQKCYYLCLFFLFFAGVKSFAWSHFGKYLVSGADRTLLFWDLFTLETVYKIEDLKSPVVYVDVQDEQNKMFAILVNKTIHVWHNITYELLQVVTDESVYKPLNVLSAMVFSPDLKMLFTAGDRITAWTLERYE